MSKAKALSICQFSADKVSERSSMRPSVFVTRVLFQNEIDRRALELLRPVHSWDGRYCHDTAGQFDAVVWAGGCSHEARCTMLCVQRNSQKHFWSCRVV
jgi:hypothetical protein